MLVLIGRDTLSEIILWHISISISIDASGNRNTCTLSECMWATKSTSFFVPIKTLNKPRSVFRLRSRSTLQEATKRLHRFVQYLRNIRSTSRSMQKSSFN